MKQYLIKPSSIQGEITIPPSKSHTLRAILFGALGDGKSTIRNYLPSTDTTAMIEACRLFGAMMDVFPDRIEIEGINGQIKYTEDVIHAGNSGIVLRFCAALGALSPHPIVVTGDHSIRHQRPAKPLIDALDQLGVHVTSMRGDGFAPLIIQGPILHQQTVLDGEDSQPVSALLIACSFADRPIEIKVKNPGEKAWVRLTLDWLDRLKIRYENDSFETYKLFGNASYKGFDYVVPGDFSSAAFPLAAALVTQSEITLKNIDVTDIQGDKEIIDVFRNMGAEIEVDAEGKTLKVKKATTLSGVTVDINNFIDAITILAVVACYADGETVIKNGAIARQKECNRIQSIATELRKMGANIEETEDGLKIKKSSLLGAQLNSYHDHRMVMSLAVAGMGARGETTICNPECTTKTFPTFLKDFQALGAKIVEFS